MMIAILQHNRMGESPLFNLIMSLLFSSKNAICLQVQRLFHSLRADPAGSGGRQLGIECSSLSKEGTQVHLAGGEEEGSAGSLSSKPYF